MIHKNGIYICNAITCYNEAKPLPEDYHKIIVMKCLCAYHETKKTYFYKMDISLHSSPFYFYDFKKCCAPPPLFF